MTGPLEVKILSNKSSRIEGHVDKDVCGKKF